MECFRGTNLRRTEIAVGTWVSTYLFVLLERRLMHLQVAQQMCGPVLQTYCIVLFQKAGLAVDQSFNMGLGLVRHLVILGIVIAKSRSTVRYRLCRYRSLLAHDQPLWTPNNLSMGYDLYLRVPHDRGFHRYRSIRQYWCIMGRRCFPHCLHFDLRFHCRTTYLFVSLTSYLMILADVSCRRDRS